MTVCLKNCLPMLHLLFLTLVLQEVNCLLVILLSMKDDSISGIYETLSDCAKISKWAGGIGLHIHNVRASGSHIRGTNGTSPTA